MPVVVPLTLLEAIDAIAANPGAMVLAGGTDALVEVNEGHRSIATGASAPVVVVVDRVAELRSWTIDPAARTVTIGAGVTYDELMEEPLAMLLPALAEASRTVGSPQIRDRWHARGQPRHVLAGRRRVARAVGTRRRHRAHREQWCPHDVGARVHGRGQAHRARPR